MNLISNCCANAYYYRDYLKCEYQNPFIWNIIKADDMYNLLKNFNNINFENISLIKYKDYFKPNTNGVIYSQYNYVLGLNVDNIFNVFFPHNYYDKNRTEVYIENASTWYYKNYELTVENWLKRIKRMKEKPIYLLITQIGSDFSEPKTIKILNDFPDENITVISSFKTLNNYNTKKHKIIYFSNVDISPQIILKNVNLTFD